MKFETIACNCLNLKIYQNKSFATIFGNALPFCTNFLENISISLIPCTFSSLSQKEWRMKLASHRNNPQTCIARIFYINQQSHAYQTCFSLSIVYLALYLPSKRQPMWQQKLLYAYYRLLTQNHPYLHTWTHIKIMYIFSPLACDKICVCGKKKKENNITHACLHTR